MDGLIKGLINVAIDAVEGAGRGRDDEDAPRRHRPARDDRQHREEEEDRGDERSRSTWAEVVSDHKGGEPEERPDHRNSRREERQERRHDGDWERVEGRKQQQHNQSEEEDRRDSNSRRPQQQQTPAYRRQQQSEACNSYRRPPSEQEYSEDASQIHHGLNVEPTREELNSLSKACSRLWELDMNRLIPGCKEVVTQQDKHEEVAFIEEIARTAPIKYLHQYLVLKGVAPQDHKDFKTMLASLWFDLYGRGGNSCSSSAFEHVFVGEIKGRGQGDDEVSGFHNWIQFYLEEANGNVDYQGYVFPRRRGELPDSETQLLTVQFEWHGVLKSVSSTLIGVSPEFELALYTLCFFMGGEDNRVDIGPFPINFLKSDPAWRRKAVHRSFAGASGDEAAIERSFRRRSSDRTGLRWPAGRSRVGQTAAEHQSGQAVTRKRWNPIPAKQLGSRLPFSLAQAAVLHMAQLRR
ncbi:hypothetical protein GUJ93_ZPchr0004g39245 [Zizania palustris]|uniref:EndoU domain-containing protein n=1 Tax=Zizania palustris TaxID=103762 RepID=A0A8J5VZK2_ZIZPA|nr:hypothetical protein GUJ93_ZPchr0004g39245 [Zizania palustris]